MWYDPLKLYKISVVFLWMHLYSIANNSRWKWKLAYWSVPKLHASGICAPYKFIGAPIMLIVISTAMRRFFFLWLFGCFSHVLSFCCLVLVFGGSCRAYGVLLVETGWGSSKGDCVDASFFFGSWYVRCLSWCVALSLGVICRLCSVIISLPVHLMCFVASIYCSCTAEIDHCADQS